MQQREGRSLRSTFLLLSVMMPCWRVRTQGLILAEQNMPRSMRAATHAGHWSGRREGERGKRGEGVAGVYTEGWGKTELKEHRKIYGLCSRQLPPLSSGASYIPQKPQPRITPSLPTTLTTAAHRTPSVQESVSFSAMRWPPWTYKMDVWLAYSTDKPATFAARYPSLCQMCFCGDRTKGMGWWWGGKGKPSRPCLLVKSVARKRYAYQGDMLG
jgi:hypothetical protein